MTLKTYSSAPLPFQGQKRMFIKHYKELLDRKIPGTGKGWTIVDAFGGSGLLAHVAKRTKPGAHVIYNDYDDYAIRLAHIEETNELRRRLYTFLISYERNKKISAQLIPYVRAMIEGFDGYKDVRALSSWLLFSGGEATDENDLFRKQLYNKIRRTDFALADDYLIGLDRVKQDFEVLLTSYQHDVKAVFILDPPYVCTAQGSYANERYFGMVEFLRLMRLVRPPYIFFSSTKSELLGYLELLLKYKLTNWQAFEGYERLDIKATVNHNTCYGDHMITKLS